MFRSVKFNEAKTGAQRHAIVGRSYDGRKVLAINGNDPCVIVQEGGTLILVQAGSVVSTEPWDAPVVARREAVLRKERPKGDLGAVIGITYAEQHGSKTVYLNDSRSFESMVVGFGMGDPDRIALKSGRVIVVEAGAVTRWHIQE